MIISFGNSDTEKLWTGIRIKKIATRNSKHWPSKIVDIKQLSCFGRLKNTSRQSSGEAIG